MCLGHTGYTLHNLKILWESLCWSLSCRGHGSGALEVLLPPRVWGLGSLMAMALLAPADSFPFTAKEWCCSAAVEAAGSDWEGIWQGCSAAPGREVWFCQYRSGVCWHRSAGGVLCCCCSCAWALLPKIFLDMITLDVYPLSLVICWFGFLDACFVVHEIWTPLIMQQNHLCH